MQEDGTVTIEETSRSTEWHRDRNTAQAYLDLAKRVHPGNWIYLILFGIILNVTPYYQNYSRFILVTGSTLLLLTLLRFGCWLYFNKIFQRSSKYWIAIYTGSSLGLAAAWGILSMHAVQNYGLDWTAMLVLLTTSGVAAGATSNIYINLKLTVAYLSTMLVPPTMALLAYETAQSEGIGAVFVLSYFVLLGVAKRLNSEYWNAQRNAELLEKRAAELEDLNKELEAFAYTISHDLRAPLRVIDGFSHALLQDLAGTLEGENLENLNRIRRSTQKLSTLIEEILRLSRISRAEMRQDRVNLSTLVHELVAKLKQADSGRNIELVIQDGVECYGDPTLLGLAVNNLIENAWKYTKRQDKACIQFYSYLNKATRVYCVKDNGIGFDMRFAEKIFNVFHRLHSTDEYPGTGVGLAIAQRVIHRHSGRIWAEGVPNEGASFCFMVGSDSSVEDRIIN